MNERQDDWRKGDWFQTYSGVKFFAYDPRPEDILVADIAHQLALQCRFNGACREFYSVAQHSVIVSQIVPPELALWGLLHDAAEAYLGDLVRPVKRGLPQYQELEANVMHKVALRFGLPLPEPAEIKTADNVVLYTERRDLLVLQPPWSGNSEPLKEKICPVGPQEAEDLFLRRFAEVAPDGLWFYGAECVPGG